MQWIATPIDSDETLTTFYAPEAFDPSELFDRFGSVRLWDERPCGKSVERIPVGILVLDARMGIPTLIPEYAYFGEAYG